MSLTILCNKKHSSNNKVVSQGDVRYLELTELCLSCSPEAQGLPNALKLHTKVGLIKKT